MSGTQGLGQAVGQAQTGAYPMQGTGIAPGATAQPMGVQIPQGVQRMQGGFGLSPQLLAQIAALQARSVPTGGAFNPQQFMQRAAPVIQNPYLGQHAANGGNGTTGY